MAATHTDAHDEGYANFLRIMQPENPPPGEDQSRPSSRSDVDAPQEPEPGAAGEDAVLIGDDAPPQRRPSRRLTALEIETLEDRYALPESTFSFLMTEAPASVPFATGVGMAAVMLTCLVLAFQDVRDKGTKPFSFNSVNPLGKRQP